MKKFLAEAMERRMIIACGRTRLDGNWRLPMMFTSFMPNRGVIQTKDENVFPNRLERDWLRSMARESLIKVLSIVFGIEYWQAFGRAAGRCLSGGRSLNEARRYSKGEKSYLSFQFKFQEGAGML